MWKTWNVIIEHRIKGNCNSLEQNDITLSELFVRLEYHCRLHNLPRNTSLEDEIEKLKEEIWNHVEGLEEQEDDNIEEQITENELNIWQRDWG